MANYMIVRQRVTDLTRFQTIFDRLKPNREAAGLTDLGQFCAAAEADAVIVVMEVEDISRAEEYWHSDVLEGRTEAGIGAYRWVGQGSSDKAKASAQAGRFRSQHLEDWLSKLMAKTPAANVKLKRAYEPPAAADGTRILIDRLWPRGISKEKAALDQWMKEIAPSTKLRKWFGHDPARWDEFRRRYATEVHDNAALLDRLRSFARAGPITLVYSAHDELHNDAVVLRDLVLGRKTA